MLSTEITREVIIATGIFLAGALTSYLASTLALMFEERISATVRPSVRPWRRAHRQALFWLLLTIATALALRSASSLDPYATAIQRSTAVIGAIFGTMALNRTSSRLLSWYVLGRLRIRPVLSNTALPIVQRFIAIAIFIVAVVFVLDTFSQPVTPLLAVLSVGGFAIALAFRDTLANFFASTTLAADGIFRVGDAIEVESMGHWGTVMGNVVGIGWRSTRIQTKANNIVSVPNSRLAESLLTNYSTPTRDLGLVVRFGVGVTSDLQRVEELAMEVAELTQTEHPGALHSSRPSLLFEQPGDAGIPFTVVLRARGYDESFRLTSDFVKAISARFAEEGIALALPSRDVFVRTLGA